MTSNRSKRPTPPKDVVDLESLNPIDYYSWQIAEQLVEEIENTDGKHAHIDIDDDMSVNVVSIEEFDIDLEYPIATRIRRKISSEITTERIVLLKHTAYTVTATIQFWQAGINTLAISIVIGNIIIWFLQDAEGRFRRRD